MSCGCGCFIEVVLNKERDLKWRVKKRVICDMIESVNKGGGGVREEQREGERERKRERERESEQEKRQATVFLCL